MKSVRVVLIVLAALAVLLAVAVGVALNSSFQTWAARRALATQPQVNAKIGLVSAGFHHVELRDLRFESNGAVLTLPKLEMDVPVVPAAVSQNVTVKRLVAKGWTLDLTKAKALLADAARLVPPTVAKRANVPREFSLLASAYGAETAARPVPLAGGFHGVFALLKLPVDFSLDGVVLEGDVILPPRGTAAPQQVKVAVHGGGLATGQEGSFAVDLASATAGGGALTLRGTATAKMDTPRSVARVAVKAAASASGPQIPAGVAVDIETAATRIAMGEDYLFQLASAGKTLAQIDGTFENATSHIAGTWSVDLHDSDLAPFALGRRLPTFAANGSGTFDTDGAFGEIHAVGGLKASASRLDALRPELAGVDTLNLSSDFDVLQHGNSLRVERLSATVADRAPIVAVNALQSFEFNIVTAELRVADPAQDLIGLSLHGLPLAWGRPFLAGLEVTGGAVQGEFAGSARDGGLELRTKSPLSIRGLALANKQGALLRDLDVTLNTSADYTPQGWQVELADFSIRHGDAALFAADAKAGRLAGDKQPLKITGHWSANLVGWLTQPAVADQLQLADGRAQGEFSASIDGTQAFESKVTLSNLIASTQEKLPVVRTELRADVASDGKIAFSAPVWFEQAGRKSDLLLAGTLAPAGKNLIVDARLTSDLMVVEDVQLLALLAPTSSPDEAEKPSNKDKAPFWSGIGGQVALALKRVVYGGTFETTNVAGTVRLDSASLKLDGLRALFGPESDLNVGGGVTFDAQARQPYAVAADVALRNFDTGAAFRAIDPAKLPTVDAHVNLNTRLTGAGANLAEAIEHTHGAMQLSGKSGVFRALSADLSGRVQKTQSTVAAIGGIIGAVTGKQELADYANKTQILSDIAKALAEIPFDQLNVTAVRDAQLNFQLQDFTLISPEVRLTGAGQISHVEEKPLLEQPLTLELHLGARGKLADLLKRASLLEAKQDNLGYASFVAPIKVGGTLAHTDTSELTKALLNSALEKGGLIDNLFGK